MLCCGALFVKKLESPVTGSASKEFLIYYLKSANFLNEDGSPKLSIWGVTEGVLAGWHNCFNHKIQLVIKDAMKVTPGMVNSIKTFQKNAAIYSRSRKERKALRDECKHKFQSYFSVHLLTVMWHNV